MPKERVDSDSSGKSFENLMKYQKVYEKNRPKRKQSSILWNLMENFLTFFFKKKN